ncbi:MAG: molybdopterin-binding protein [Pirellulaceae bacterium]
MLAEIVAIGDELVTGERLDTNSQWLARRMGELGVRALFHTTVGDDMEANQAVLVAASQRTDVVVITGGLGPTADDLTREAVALAFAAPLERDEQVLASIRELFRRRGREMPERNAVQADFPKSARVVPNPHGSAPGFWLEVPRPRLAACHVIALPGVPAEMKQMWEESVGPQLATLLGESRQLIRHKTLHCFGAGRVTSRACYPISFVVAAIRWWASRPVARRSPCESPRAEEMTRSARLVSRQWFRRSAACLGSLVFGEDGERLEQVVVRQLMEQGRTLAVYDAVSSGRILQWLRDADPTGVVFVGGTLLSHAHGATGEPGASATEASEEPEAGDALRLASECRSRFGTDWGLALRVRHSTSPSADGAEEWIELALTDGITQVIESQRFAAHPDVLLPRAAKQGLDLIRRIVRPSIADTTPSRVV